MNSKDKRKAASGEPQLNPEQGGFAFVMNIASLDAESYELTPRSVLRRASNSEIELIKGRNVSFGPLQMFGLFPSEGKLDPLPPRIGRLPPAKWRYFVIGFKGTNSEVDELQSASCVAQLELEVGFTLTTTGAMVWHPDRLFQTLKLARPNRRFFCKVTSADIEQLKSIYTLYQKGENQTRQMVAQLLGLKGLPYDSQLRFLGYFAILESIPNARSKTGGPVRLHNPSGQEKTCFA